MTCNFETSTEDRDLILKIAKRAHKMASDTAIQVPGAHIPDVMTITLFIAAAHANGCPLKLQELLDADNFNFAHDVFGICRHLDQETGEIEHFLPRFARGTTKPRSPYYTAIAELAPGYDPRHVEAYMRVEHPTLDHLDKERFAAEVRVACKCIDQGGLDLAEQCALSYGL